MKRGAIVACIVTWLTIAWLLHDPRAPHARGATRPSSESNSQPPSSRPSALSLPGEPVRLAPQTFAEAQAEPLAQAPQREPVRTEDSIPSERLDKLFADLRNDRIRGNAGSALFSLERLLKTGPATRATSRERAERALDSYDLQEVDLCTELLLSCALRAWHDVDRAPPHDRALERAANLLSGGRALDYGIVYRSISRYALEIAIAYPDAMAPWIVPQLGHPIYIHRRTAAVALACAGQSQHAAQIVDILLPSLQDNDTDKDALTAAFALKQLGPAALPRLPHPDLARDPQQRYLLEAIRMELERPGSSTALGRGPGVSRSAPNAPLVEWRPPFIVRRK